MNVKLCPDCLNVYSSNLISSNNCPSYECGNEMISIDSDLYEILPNLIDLGFNIKKINQNVDSYVFCATLGDIVSFSIKDDPSAFIIFEDKNLDKLKELSEVCKNIAQNFQFIYVSDIIEDEKCLPNFTIYCNKIEFIKSLNIEDAKILDIIHLYYEYKKNFVQFLYSLIDKILDISKNIENSEKELEVLNE